jgi:hypothetical protein
MEYPLDGCWTKIKWANNHLHALDAEIAAWAKANAQPPLGEFYPEANVHVFWWNIPDPPLDWGVRIGDVVHNLRSALDHLVWQLSATPKAGTRGNQFPIFKAKPTEGFDKKTRDTSLYGVPGPIRAKIESLQPYVRDPKAIKDNHLVILNRLSNRDKHQLVPVLAITHGPFSGQSGAFGAGEDSGPIEDFWMSTSGRLKPGTVIAWFRAAPTGPNPKVEMQRSLPVAIEMEDGRNAISTLSDLAQSVNSIVNYFIPEIGSWERSAFYDG